MKENIDLTENRDFRKEGFDVLQEASLRRMIIKVKDKNRFNIPNENSYIEKDNGGIIQGNASFRYTKRVFPEFGKGNYCDKCGKKIKPYVNDTLCSQCVKDLKNHEILW